MSSPERFPALKPDSVHAEREDMAIDPLHTLQLTAGPQAEAAPAEVAHLGVVPDEAAAVEPTLEEVVAELRRRLETERSAGRALLQAMSELEHRLEVERATSDSLRVSVDSLDATLAADRASLSAQRKANGQLWSQVHDLKQALEQAERPMWRKLLRRS